MDLDTAVAAARSGFVAAHPVSAAWSDRARRVLPGGNTRSVLQVDPFPIRVDRAAGKHLWDLDGHRYVDLLGNYTAGLLGHSPEPVLAAARGALDSGWSLGAVHENEVRLAELVVDRFPSIDQVRFTNSGTEANLMTLAVATHHTGRHKIIVFRNGYHGGVITFGNDTNPVNVPHDWVLCDFNDLDSVRAAFTEHANTEHAGRHNGQHGNTVAAVLVEPMQGSGGCIPGDVDFLTGLRELCDEHGSLLIFDEVMTSRFSPGGAQQLFDVVPDMTTLGKYLAGGFSFGAFGGRADIMANFDPAAGGTLGHAGTFNNNVISMAAGVAVLDEILSPEVLDEVHVRGDSLRDRLNAMFASKDLPMCASGVGSLLTIHGTTGPVQSAADLADVDDRLKELFYFHCLAGGYYLARRGFIALSIEITDDDIDAFMNVVDRFQPSPG